MEIKANVDNQKIKITTNLKTFVSGTQEFIKFTFNFMDSAWDGLTIFAQFRQGNTAYNKYLDNNKSVCLPPEIEPGECYLTLHGTRGDVVAVTDGIKLTITANKLVSNAESTEITTSLYSQLVNMIGGLRFETKTKQSVTETYNSSYIWSFNGKSIFPDSYPNSIFLFILNGTNSASMYLAILGESGSTTVSTIKLDSNTGTLPKIGVSTSGYLYSVWSSSNTEDIRANIFKLK